MILELDCGNTRIKWRLIEGLFVIDMGSVSSFAWQVELVPLKEAADCQSVNRVVVSSVLGESFRRQFSLWVMEHLSVVAEFAVSEVAGFGVINGYQDPDRLGVDRWLGLIGSRQRTKKSCIVVDCGSAVTVDLLTSEGEHLGGYIAPGISLMRDALGSRTVQIKLGQVGYAESDLPGRNTVAAIKSAELAMLNGIVEASRACLSAYRQDDVALIITGGDGEWLSQQLGGLYVESLVFEGLETVMGIEGVAER